MHTFVCIMVIAVNQFIAINVKSKSSVKKRVSTLFFKAMSRVDIFLKLIEYIFLYVLKMYTWFFFYIGILFKMTYYFQNFMRSNTYFGETLTSKSVSLEFSAFVSVCISKSANSSSAFLTLLTVPKILSSNFCSTFLCQVYKLMLKVSHDEHKRYNLVVQT